MNQRIVCRFCDWHAAFVNGVDYLVAKADFEQHLESHKVAMVDELSGECCLECGVTRIIPHCMNQVCDWQVCLHCKMIWSDMAERAGFCYASDEDDKRRNGV